MSVLHFSYASDGGASRAGRRASLACSVEGIPSNFAFITGEAIQSDDIKLTVAPGTSSLNHFFHDQIQWEFIRDQRTPVSNTLLSIPYPGADVRRHRVFETAEIIHLHWPTWGITPRAIADMLVAGRTVFWTLHDVWPMTGGCHYPGSCRQFESLCMKCPQMRNDYGLVANSFAEKLQAYGHGGSLWIIAPSEWMAETARNSRILGTRTIDVVRNPIELDVFKPRRERAKLREAIGVEPTDLVLMAGSFDLAERRKGVRLLIEAIEEALADGSLAERIGPNANLHLIIVGKSPDFEIAPAVRLLNFGAIADDRVMADILSVADLVVIPSLEDNYPNMIIEAMACGTPALGFRAGGIGEMIKDGRTGLLVDQVGSVSALKHGLLRFVDEHFVSASMRTACRAAAVADNDPAKIGRQLRELYERALGRPLRHYDPPMRSRMLAAYAKSPVQADTEPGTQLLQFPANVGLAARAADQSVLRKRIGAALPRVEAETRLLTVRTFHAHHSGRSGPYQFLRHLSRERYDASHIAVPLGTELVGASAELMRKAGALMGTVAFGQQANGWLAEAEVLIKCANEKIDLIHYIDGELGGWLLPTMPDSIFRNEQRPAIIVTYHQPEEILKDLINADVIARYDGVVTLCRTQQQMLQRFLDPERVFLIPHGVDTQFFHPLGSPKVARPLATTRLLLVGHWLRDLKVAMDAFAALKSRGRFELTIVSPNFPLPINDTSIRLLSGLTDEELREEYWSADFLFLPLIDATANNAILEAMACGLPVISTAIGGVPEMVGEEGGILCPRGDAAAFTAVTLMLASATTEQRTKIRHKARARAELFAWERIGAMHDEVYRTVLARRAANLSRQERTITLTHE